MVQVPATDLLFLMEKVATLAQMVTDLQAQRQPSTSSSPQGGNPAMEKLMSALVQHLAAQNGDNPIVKTLASAMDGKPGSVDNLIDLVGKQSSDPLLAAVVEALKAKR